MGTLTPAFCSFIRMLSEEILYLPVRTLGERLRARSISPVDLTESYLERSEKLGPKLNAYAKLTPELALRQAHAAGREIAAGHYRGPLHGIPYAAKDLLAVRGYPTTWGARPYAGRTFDYDATVIGKLHRAGAILIGKAAMIELAGGLGYESGAASLSGPARNPWNRACWTCGSSSGSGAIVAAALAPWAIGSDTRGSIICPSAWCGISGMRPSFGLVSRHGCMAIAWSMDKLGPMARTADDCGLLLAAMSGHDPRDTYTLPAAAFRYPDPAREPKRLRIGYLTNVWNRLDGGLEAALRDALSVLRGSGARISNAQIPEGPYEEAAELTILIEAASAFQGLIHSGGCGRLQDPLGQVNGYASEEFSASDYLQVQRVRAALQQKVDRLFESFDVLVTAGQSTVAQPLEPPRSTSGEEPPEPRESRAPDGVSSLCGLPAIAVPCGFSKERLPYSIQFIARAGHDHAAIAAAREYQRLTSWHRERPALSNL